LWGVKGAGRKTINNKNANTAGDIRLTLNDTVMRICTESNGAKTSIIIIVIIIIITIDRFGSVEGLGRLKDIHGSHTGNHNLLLFFS